MLPESIIMEIILILVSVGVLMSIICLIMYALFNNKLKRAIEGVIEIVKDTNNEVRHERKLFAEHFKTTDKTIEDTRKERDYWKTLALKKKSGRLK